MDNPCGMSKNGGIIWNIFQYFLQEEVEHLRKGSSERRNMAGNVGAAEEVCSFVLPVLIKEKGPPQFDFLYAHSYFYYILIYQHHTTKNISSFMDFDITSSFDGEKKHIAGLAEERNGPHSIVSGKAGVPDSNRQKEYLQLCREVG